MSCLLSPYKDDVDCKVGVLGGSDTIIEEEYIGFQYVIAPSLSSKSLSDSLKEGGVTVNTQDLSTKSSSLNSTPPDLQGLVVSRPVFAAHHLPSPW